MKAIAEYYSTLQVPSIKTIIFHRRRKKSKVKFHLQIQVVNECIKIKKE